MKKLLDYKALSADYASYHTDRRNRACHMIGIPLIVFCVVRWTQTGSWFPWAAAVLPLYAAWDVALSLLMAGMLFTMAAIAPYAPGWLVWACFAAGWVFQFLGHRYEGKSPAFLKNLLHVLVGPLWILSEASDELFRR
jgi:uncharacterized membrane protein YGL010W